MKSHNNTAPTLRTLDMPRLVVERPDVKEVRHHLSGEEVTIGRDPSNRISIPDNFISKFHAKILINETSMVLVDLQSANKTYVNGRPISEAPLRYGDRIRFAAVNCRLEAPESQAKQAAAPPPSAPKPEPPKPSPPPKAPATPATPPSSRAPAKRPAAKKPGAAPPPVEADPMKRLLRIGGLLILVSLALAILLRVLLVPSQVEEVSESAPEAGSEAGPGANSAAPLATNTASSSSQPTTEITVRLADLANNPVRDGTTVQFRTEYGRVQPSCNTADGTCTVTWNSQEPRRPLNPNTEVPTLNESDVCPTPLVFEESVTINGSDGDTGYMVSSIGRVETTGDVQLTEGAGNDFTVDEDGSGITCEAGSANCTDGNTLKITYFRAWPDEDVPDGDTEHTISNPGIATAPFVQRTGAPCGAGFREASEDVPAYNGGLGQVYGGRASVLAFAQGEESFTDTNGNGLYDEGEPFIDLTEAFVDHNEDAVFGNGDPDVDDSSNNEPENWNCYGPAAPLAPNNPPLDRCFQEGGDEDGLVDFNQDGQFNTGNGIYNGTLCPKEVNGQPPDFCTRELVNIRRTITILSAGSQAFIGVRDASTGEFISQVDLRGDPASGQFDAPGAQVTTNDGTVLAPGDDFTIGFGDSQVAPGIGEIVSLRSGSGSVIVDFSDVFNGLMPAGTSVSVDPDACDISGTESETVASSNGFGFSRIGFTLGALENPVTDSGVASVTVSSPGGGGQGGITTLRQFGCAY